YGTSVGSGVNVTTSTGIPRVVATFDAAGVYNRPIVSTTDFSGVNWRGAATDGTNNFWGTGSAGGVIYLGNQSADSIVQNAKPNDRVVEIFNGNLFMSSASPTSDGFTGIYKFNGLPKSNVGLPPVMIATNTVSTTG